MKAAVYSRYGPPEVVRVAEVDKPVPGPDELLIRVRATTVNRTDCGIREANPVLVRLFTGLMRPRQTILGSEFAGKPEQRDIRLLKELIEDGAFTAVIDRRYPLDAIVDAYRYVDTGQKTGNVVITVA